MGCRKGGIQEKRDAGKERYRKGGMKDREEFGLEGCRKGGIYDWMYSIQKRMEIGKKSSGQ